MKPQDPIFSQNLWTAIRFSLGLLGTALLLASVYAWGWSMTGDAFGQISQGKINILRHATPRWAWAQTFKAPRLTHSR